MGEHGFEIMELAVSEGTVSALKKFNKLLTNDEGPMWPHEWFENKTLVGVLGACGGPVAEVFEHYVKILDFFLYVRDIEDIYQWQKDMIEKSNRLQKEAEENYRHSSSLMKLDCFSDDVIAYMNAVTEYDTKGAALCRESWGYRAFANPAFAKRGKPTKSGWAVNTLAFLLGKYRADDDFAIIVTLLRDIGAYEITRQTVRGIIKKGLT